MMINESVGEWNYRQKKAWRKYILRRNFLKNSSENILGALFWNLSMGGKDADFGGILMKLSFVILQLKYIYSLIVINI